MERMPYYLDASAGPHFPSEIGLNAPLMAYRAEPRADTHIVQVGERSGLPRGRLLRTERIPEERHLWPDKGKVNAPLS